MNRKNEPSIASLIDFSVSRYGTPALAQYAYLIAFVMCLLQAILGIAYSLSFVQAAISNAGLQFIVGTFLIVLNIVWALFELIVVRLVLEYLVVQFNGKATDEAGVTPVRTPSVAPSKPEAIAPKVVPQIAEGEWRCRCGTVNQEGTAFCTNCKRAPNAIL